MKIGWQSYALARFRSASRAVSSLWHYSEWVLFSVDRRKKEEFDEERKIEFSTYRWFVPIV